MHSVASTLTCSSSSRDDDSTNTASPAPLHVKYPNECSITREAGSPPEASTHPVPAMPTMTVSMANAAVARALRMATGRRRPVVAFSWCQLRAVIYPFLLLPQPTQCEHARGLAFPKALQRHGPQAARAAACPAV